MFVITLLNWASLSLQANQETGAHVESFGSRRGEFLNSSLCRDSQSDLGKMHPQQFGLNIIGCIKISVSFNFNAHFLSTFRSIQYPTG